MTHENNDNAADGENLAELEAMEARRQEQRPDSLMKDVSKSTMRTALPIAIAAHVLVLALTSVPFIARCVQYRTLHPQQAMAEIARAEDEAKAIADRKAKTASRPATAPADDDGGAAATPATRSAIERTLDETSDEKPKDPGLDMADIGTLE